MARNYHCFKWLVVFIFITCFATSAFATSTGTVYESDGITPITGNTINISLYKKSICDTSTTWVQAV